MLLGKKLLSGLGQRRNLKPTAQAPMNMQFKNKKTMEEDLESDYRYLK